MGKLTPESGTLTVRRSLDMMPDQIRAIALDVFPEFDARERKNPDGWSFWLSETGDGGTSVRIFRALAKSPGSEIKWSISGITEQWGDSPEVLVERIRREIDLYKTEAASLADKIPDGLTREHIVDAINALDSGIEHAFGQSTGYDVLYEGRRYPPKAVIGIAAKHLIGRQLGPYDFKGGRKSRCFRILEQNHFEIVTKGDTSPYPDDVEESDIHIEGAVTQTVVNRYERDPKARAKCIRKYGSTCQVCGMDFEKTYGAIGEGFIHVHHLKQLSEIGEEYEVDPIADMVPVCPNCHAMLHKRMPPFSIDELRKMLDHDLA
jgi:5-methylcytosine-specific restriction enzyme A